jgi:rRNA-processing protein FCF1
MRYTRVDYENFLNTELETQMTEYERLVETKAIVLKNRGDVFVGRYQTMQPNGIAILKVRVSDNMPRKNTFWTASYLNGNMGSFKNWGDLSWSELRKNHQKDYSDAYCAWIGKSDDPNFCLIGIKGLSMEFAKLLEHGNTIVAFGPKDPPLKYLINLIDIVRDNESQSIKSVLNYEFQTDNQWHPMNIDVNANFADILLRQIEDVHRIIVQGPPGTGKTYKMAQLAAKLLEQRKSVLVTALTNQALIELASKDDLQQFLEGGKVSKTSLTVDESKELPKLKSNEGNVCNAAEGYLSLATFYISSGWAKDAEIEPFDYVIMDEASQALFPMIAAVLKLGKNTVWIGDQNQLSPIVITNENVINKFGWGQIVKGFDTLCKNLPYKSFRLSDTYRLTPRGASFTGLFYDGKLRSISEHQQIETNLPILNKAGGPSLINLDMKVGDKAPSNAFSVICKLVTDILRESPKARLAVLSKFRETVRQLQKSFMLNSNLKEIPENVKIETVDRVQGLTVDYCIFLIPNVSIQYSLDKELFNVATSRAKFCTIIVAEKSLLNNDMSEEVRKYIQSIDNERLTYTIESPAVHTISSGNIELTIVDKIDLSKFEQHTKGRVYIIDTNVFVNCPNIISRIGKHNSIVLSAKAIDELDKLKITLDDKGKKAVQEALRNINKSFESRKLRMETADVSLLPNDFNKKSPDNQILTVVLKVQDENPILLTSDNGLQIKAKGLKIETVSLKEFLSKSNY